MDLRHQCGDSPKRRGKNRKWGKRQGKKEGGGQGDSSDMRKKIPAYTKLATSTQMQCKAWYANNGER